MALTVGQYHYPLPQPNGMFPAGYRRYGYPWGRQVSTGRRRFQIGYQARSRWTVFEFTGLVGDIFTIPVLRIAGLFQPAVPYEFETTGTPADPGNIPINIDGAASTDDVAAAMVAAFQGDQMGIEDYTAPSSSFTLVQPGIGTLPETEIPMPASLANQIGINGVSAWGLSGVSAHFYGGTSYEVPCRIGKIFAFLPSSGQYREFTGEDPPQ